MDYSSSRNAKIVMITMVSIFFLLLFGGVTYVSYVSAQSSSANGGNANGGTINQGVGTGVACNVQGACIITTGPQAPGGNANGGTINQGVGGNVSINNKAPANINNDAVFLVAESHNSGNPQNPYATRIGIIASENTLSEIDKVIYHLHPTFHPNEIEIDTKENNFGYSFTNWGFFTIRATVYFNDGHTQEIQIPQDKWIIDK